MNNFELSQIKAYISQAKENASLAKFWQERAQELEKDNILKDKHIARLEKRISMLKGEQS